MMKYAGLPAGMWMLYHGSFRKHLITGLGFSEEAARRISKYAKPKFKAIIAKLPEFEKGDRFTVNIVNCALLIAFLQSMDRRPGVEELTEYYAAAMTMSATKIFWQKRRKDQIHEEGYRRHEGYGGPQCCRPESLFLEYGFSSV